MKQIIALINRKYQELYNLIAHSTKENWGFNEQNQGNIDDVIVDNLETATTINNLKESVDDIIVELLKD